MKNPNGSYTWFAKVTAVGYGKVGDTSEFTLISVSNSFIRNSLKRNQSYLVIEGHLTVQVGSLLKVTDDKYPDEPLSELLEVVDQTADTTLLKRRSHDDPFGYLIFHNVDDCHDDCMDPGHFFVQMDDEARAEFCQANFSRGKGFTGWGTIYYPYYINAGYGYWTKRACRAVNRMYRKLYQMDVEDLITIWVALASQTWGKDDMYDAGEGISMDTWANAVYSVGSSRGIKMLEEERKRKN